MFNIYSLEKNNDDFSMDECFYYVSQSKNEICDSSGNEFGRIFINDENNIIKNIEMKSKNIKRNNYKKIYNYDKYKNNILCIDDDLEENCNIEKDEIEINTLKERQKRKCTYDDNWIKFIKDSGNDLINNSEKQLYFYEKNVDVDVDIKTLKEENKKTINIIDKQIRRKIAGYKNQDIKKKLFDDDKFISFDFIKNKLLECKLTCFYCQKNVFIIYEDVRDPLQWSVDRINNNYGHNYDNIVIACLKCNLQRRCRKSEEFNFTTNMKIIKEE